MVYKVILMGTSGSGKSTMINSIAKKRVIGTGFSHFKYFNEIQSPLCDDNNNEFYITDTNKSCYSKNINDTITDYNLVLFVNDIYTKFPTDEYNNIKDVLNNHTKLTGVVHNIAIVLSKCDDSVLYDDVIRKVKEYGDVILFNSFGRIKQCNAQNTTFDITKYYKDHEETQEDAYYKKFLEFFDTYFWNKLQLKTQNKFFEEFNIDLDNTKLMEFIETNYIENIHNVNLKEHIYKYMFSKNKKMDLLSNHTYATRHNFYYLLLFDYKKISKSDYLDDFAVQFLVKYEECRDILLQNFNNVIIKWYNDRDKYKEYIRLYMILNSYNATIKKPCIVYPHSNKMKKYRTFYCDNFTCNYKHMPDKGTKYYCKSSDLGHLSNLLKLLDTNNIYMSYIHYNRLINTLFPNVNIVDNRHDGVSIYNIETISSLDCLIENVKCSVCGTDLKYFDTNFINNINQINDKINIHAKYSGEGDYINRSNYIKINHSLDIYRVDNIDISDDDLNNYFSDLKKLTNDNMYLLINKMQLMYNFFSGDKNNSISNYDFNTNYNLFNTFNNIKRVIALDYRYEGITSSFLQKIINHDSPISFDRLAVSTIKKLLMPVKDQRNDIYSEIAYKFKNVVEFTDVAIREPFISYKANNEIVDHVYEFHMFAKTRNILSVNNIYIGFSKKFYGFKNDIVYKSNNWNVSIVLFEIKKNNLTNKDFADFVKEIKRQLIQTAENVYSCDTVTKLPYDELLENDVEKYYFYILLNDNSNKVRYNVLTYNKRLD